jgi:hypothetical protein
MNALEEKMKQKDIDKFREDLITWFEREQRILPWRENQDPYRVHFFFKCVHIFSSDVSGSAFLDTVFWCKLRAHYDNMLH